MIDLLSKAGLAGYTKAAKPLLFKFKADTVHESMVSSGNLLQGVPLFTDLTRRSFRYDDPILETTVAGIQFKNPLGLSAGLDKDAKLVRMMEAVGFGFEECGSVTHSAYVGNPQPWYTRLPNSRSIIVNAGLKSEGAEAVAARIEAEYSPEFLADFPLNVSIAKTNSPETNDVATGIADYVATLVRMEQGGRPRLYTLNISCPNTSGGEPFTDPKALDTLLAAIGETGVKKPVFIKLPIDKTWDQARQLLEVAARHDFVKGITLGNLYKDRSTVKLEDPLPEGVKGNFSGRPCWEASNELLAKGYQNFGDRFAFSGVGGVFTAEDAYHKIKLGASLVEMVTGLIFQGPAVVGALTRRLAQLIATDGFTHVADAVGVENTKQ